MKKFFMAIIVCCLVFTFSGCEKVSSTIEVDKNVTLQLLDVLQIKNTESNTLYYYYLAMIDNQSQKEYATDGLIYEISDNAETKINPIDSYQSTPISTIPKKESTYIYGYVGFPNNDQKNIGIFLPNQEQFLPFKSVDVKEATNKDVKSSQDDRFIWFENNALSIQIDTSELTEDFVSGNTVYSHLKITYKNKSDDRIVIPYLIPSATLHGVDTTKYKDKGDFASMDLNAAKAVDYSVDGKVSAADYEGIASGYMAYYLDPKQEIVCDINLTFEHVVGYKESDDQKSLLIKLNSKAFGETIEIER